MFPITNQILITAIFIIVCIRKYKENSWGRCKNRIKLNGKVAIVTGANSGIGYETAKELAARGAHVVMACRNLQYASAAICRIKRELKGSSIIYPMELDLESIKSIKNFVDEIRTTYSAVDILVNNAGVAYPHKLRLKTKAGFEIHFGINYLGHFVLTNLLIDMLDNAYSSRIIVVSSLLHEIGKIHLDDLNLNKITENSNPYANSKLANVYFCNELAKRLQGTQIDIYTVCPGWVHTNLFRHQNLRWYHRLLSLPAALFFMRTPNQGAQTVIYCATEPNLISGAMYRNCTLYRSKVNFDPMVSSKLWEVSCEMVKGVDNTLNMPKLCENQLL